MHCCREPLGMQTLHIGRILFYHTEEAATSPSRTA